jgi:SecD/SecF fusion protein
MREGRSHLVLLGVLLAMLVAIAALAIPASPIHKEPTLGLDLQGGLEVVLEARPESGQQLTEADLDRSVEIIRERIDKLGVTEPDVRKQGDNQIAVQLAGVFDTETAVRIIGKTAQLHLYDLQKNLQDPSRDPRGGFPIASPTLWTILNDSTVKRRADRGKPSAFFLFDAKNKRIAGPKDTRAELLDGRKVRALLVKGKLPKKYKVRALPAKTIILRCGIDQRYCPGANEAEPSRTYYYLMKFDINNEDEPVPEMTGRDFDLDGTQSDFDTRTNEPIVSMQFTDSGGKKFHDVTRELAQRGQVVRSTTGVDDEIAFQQFAIVLDDVIQSAPVIDFNENPNGIPPGGGAQISGIGSLSEAQDLALVLQTGALPVNFVVLEQTDVSSTLGADSLRQALQAAIAGLILVAIFLLVFYRFLGLVAVLGLGLYAAVMYAVILLFNVTLSLPGFAGMILAIGVAADANIVIFERIKEEAAGGKSVRAAISSGYTKGLATIIDANVVTAITALILFAVATAGVRGFAFLLLLGTVTSILTAVFATRALLGILSRFRWFDNPKFMGASAQKIANWQKFDAVGKRRIWFTISGILIALSIASIAIKGLNLGIDFKGGSQLAFATPRPVEVADVREEAQKVGREGAQIQGKGKEVAGGFREFKITTRPLETEQLERLTRALETRFDARSRGARNVSASFSAQILRNAILAMLVSFALITAYIAFRFQWRFAVPILRTIANDGLIALGVYSIAGREVTSATVAAFLTIIGYSIYDTIIIFDRVRENLPIMRRATVAQIVNQSLWETIRRSLATTFITLLPVAALFFFGGDTLKDFAFAILIGIGISAFSTIFIAAPFLAVLLERHPEYKHRKAGAPGVDDGKPFKAPSLKEPEPTVAEPAEVPEAAPVAEKVPVGDGDGAESARSKRERRRQRRRTRPHGRR